MERNGCYLQPGREVDDVGFFVWLFVLNLLPFLHSGHSEDHCIAFLVHTE